MGYIGNSYAQQAVQPATDFFNGNGSTTSFALTRPLQTVYTVEVVVNNVQQNPATAYSISGNTIIFTAAPSTGTNNIYVNYNAITAQTSVQPGQGTVGNQQLAAITNIASGANNFTLQTGSPSTTALTIDQTQKITASSSLNSNVGFGIPAWSFEKFVGTTYFANGSSNLAVNIQFGNIAMGGMFEVSITSSYSYQNAGGGIKKIFSVLTNPSNNIYTNESRVTEAIGPIVNNFSIGELQWDSASSQYIIPISHTVSSGNAANVFLKVISPGNADGAFAGASLGNQYTLSPLSRNYETFNNTVYLNGGAQVTSPLQISGGYIYNGNNTNQFRMAIFSISTYGGNQYMHMKTDQKTNNSNMYRFEYSGYDYGSGQVLAGAWVGYLYSASDASISNGIANWGNRGFANSVYRSSDGYLVLVADMASYYCSFAIHYQSGATGQFSPTITAYSQQTGTGSVY
jgi:hypothetical protein